MANSFTVTKAYGAKLKAQDARMSPEQRRAVSKGLVESNSAANNKIGKSVKNSTKSKKR